MRRAVARVDRTARRPRARVGLFVPLGAGLALIVIARAFSIAQSSAHPSPYEERLWSFGETPAGPMSAVALVPRVRSSDERFPLLVAFHGRGESSLGADRGAYAWARDYGLGACDGALRRAHLRREDFFGFVRDERLAQIRADLRARPYRGLVVVTPYTPDVLNDGGASVEQATDRFVTDVLVPRARRELPVLATREATGIDGVSLGGLHALSIGFAHPEIFGTVEALQAAVRDREEAVADRYVPNATRPAQRIRLVTSDGDPLRPDVEQLSQVLHDRGIAHELRVLVGPHDYDFNRGPGGIEMLLFHDRALRGETPI